MTKEAVRQIVHRSLSVVQALAEMNPELREDICAALIGEAVAVAHLCGTNVDLIALTVTRVCAHIKATTARVQP